MGARTRFVVHSGALVVMAMAALCLACRGIPAEPAAQVPVMAALSPATSAYVGGVVGEGGTISGIATYAGPAVDEVLVITRDHASCGGSEGGSFSRPAGALVVSEGRVANVVVWLEGMKHGKPLFQPTVTIDNVGCAFVPRVAVGFVGGKVAAQNSDPVLHSTNLSFVSDGKSIANLALPDVGARMTRNLRRPGLVSVRCDAHEWMQGWLHVFDHPYATSTDDSGAFTLTDVPAGSYTLKIWHERLGELALPVSVVAGGSVIADVVLR